MILEGLYLPAGRCHLLAGLRRPAVAAARLNGGAPPAGLLELLDEAERLARAHRAVLLGTPGTPGIPAEGARSTLDGMSGRSTREAAGLLGVCERAVRARCARGTLPATRTPAGWRVHLQEGS